MPMDRRSEIRRILEEIISKDSERNRDNSGNRPVLISTSVSGEQPSTSHRDVQSQPLVFVCTSIKVSITVNTSKLH